MILKDKIYEKIKFHKLIAEVFLSILTKMELNGKKQYKLGNFYIAILLALFITSCTAKNSYNLGGGSAVVESGETIYSIAKRHNIPVQDLINANNLQPPYIVKVGKKLTIPQIKYHIVRAGDNLYQISRLYNVKIEKLAQLNNLEKPYNISVGSKLIISNSTPSSSNNSKISNNKTIKVEKPKVATADPSNIREEIAPKTNHNFIWPAKGEIVSSFGQKAGGLYNDGINIQAAQGTSVKATENGVVAYVGNELRGYGNLIIIKHADSWISAYAHLSKTSVKIGDEVKKGMEIANVGATGNVNSPQLYFGIRKGKNAVNPTKYLK